MRFIVTLKRALTLHYILAASIPVVVFALIAINYAQTYLLDKVQEQSQFLAREIRQQTSDFLDRPVELLRHISITLTDEKHMAGRAIDDFLEAEVRGSGFFESVYILNEYGRVVHLGVSNKLEKQKQDYYDIDMSSHELFQSFSGADEPYWSDTFISVVTGEPSVTLGLPLGSQILVGNLSLVRLNSILARLTYAEDLTFAIVDRKGTLIAHSDPDYAIQRVNMLFHPEIHKALDKGVETALHEHEDHSLIESVVMIPKIGWAVWVARDRESVLEPVTQVQQFLLIALVMSISLGVLLALLTSRRLMRPLSSLVEGTRKLAAGEQGIHVEKAAYREIEELETSFNQMTHAVVEREQSIRQSEARFRELVNSIDGIVWEMDFPSYRFQFVSNHAEKMLGYPVEEWLDDPGFWKDHIHPDDRQWAFDYCFNQSRQMLPHQSEYRMQRKDGEYIWVRDMVSVVVDDGEPVRLVGVFIDITSTKEAEIALTESEKRFRSLVEQAADAIFIHDDEGRIQQVNEQACALLGYSREELLQMTYGDLEAEYDPLQLSSTWNTVQHGSTLTLETELVGKSGAASPVEIRLGSLLYQERPLFVALVRDITERKKAEQNIRETRDRLQLLIDSMPVGCIVFDAEQRVTLWNPVAETIFGYPAKDAIGRSRADFLQSTDAADSERSMITALIGGDAMELYQVENLTRDGQTIYCDWYNTPITDASGEFVGVISMVQDVTERKLLQQQSIRTAQLASLGELAAGVAHEINNPINGVINYAQILLNRLQKQGLETDLAERIIKEGDRIAVIVKDLLFFAREGSPEMNPSRISTILGESLSLTESQIRKEGILLQVDLPDDLPMVRSRAQQLQQLFLNILSNARHALTEKYPLKHDDKIIEISARQRKRSGRVLVEIKFKDHGTGIPKQMLDKVMNPFVTTKPSGIGTGLGLSISHEIVKNHDGDISIASVEGEYTSVTVTLPALREDD